jgi:hypothetical protein
VHEARGERFQLQVIRALLTGFTFFRAVLHVLPIARPFLSPLKGQAAALADLRWEAVLCLGFHAVILCLLVTESNPQFRSLLKRSWKEIIIVRG